MNDKLELLDRLQPFPTQITLSPRRRLVSANSTTEEEDDWEDDEGTRNLRPRRKHRCSELEGDEWRCELHQSCCYRRRTEECFRC